MNFDSQELVEQMPDAERTQAAILRQGSSGTPEGRRLFRQKGRSIVSQFATPTQCPMSATGRELDAPLLKPATTSDASTRSRIGMESIQNRDPLPFKFPATASPGAEHDATIIDMINDNSSWADIEAVAGTEAFDRYYTMLDPDLEAFWDKEAMIRLNKIVWGFVVQGNKLGDSSSSSSSSLDSDLASAMTTAPTTADLAVLADGLPWEKIAVSMDASAAVCRHIWSTFGDGRPLSEQERVLLAMEDRRRRRRLQIEKQEQERIAREQERARIKAEKKQEQERVAKEEEQARLKAEELERERVAKEEAKAWLKAEKQEQERIAKEEAKARTQAKKQARARIKADKEKWARLAAEQVQEQRERAASEKKATEARLRAEESDRLAQTSAESEGLKSSLSSAECATELVTDSEVPNGDAASRSRAELEVTTRHQRTRLQVQSSQIQRNKTLLEQAWKLRCQADEFRQQRLSILLSRQAAYRIKYSRLFGNKSIPVPHQHSVNEETMDLVSPKKHALVSADNDIPNGDMTTASSVTCSPALYDPHACKRPYKRSRPKTRPIFVPRFKEVIQQAEQQAELQRQSDLQQRNRMPPPTTPSYVHYVYVYGVGLVRKPVSDNSQVSEDVNDAQKHASGANSEAQPILPASMLVSKTGPLTNTVAGANPGTMVPFNMPPPKDVMGSPDSANVGPNPHYDILTWSSEDMVCVWNFWVQYGDQWDYISKTVLSGRHSPQECRAFVMGAGFA
ncbi:hypothetical protein EC968_000306 [Mortierella alpina]|nr:hypothetical protein EC968_000306 [Mortierella alpina]